MGILKINHVPKSSAMLCLAEEKAMTEPRSVTTQAPEDWLIDLQSATGIVTVITYPNTYHYFFLKTSWLHVNYVVWIHVITIPKPLMSLTKVLRDYYFTWWRHQMETFSALLAHCAGNSPVIVEFSSQRSVARSFDVFFDLHLNKRLSKQSWVKNLEWINNFIPHFDKHVITYPCWY